MCTTDSHVMYVDDVTISELLTSLRPTASGRAINNNLLDTYQLKSLDGLLETDLRDIRLVRHKGRIHVRPAGGAAPRPSRRRALHRTVVMSVNSTAGDSDWCSAERELCSPGRGAEEEERTEDRAEPRGAPEPSEVQDNFSMRNGYDAVIGCLGFKFDFSIFDR